MKREELGVDLRGKVRRRWVSASSSSSDNIRHMYKKNWFVSRRIQVPFQKSQGEEAS